MSTRSEEKKENRFIGPLKKHLYDLFRSEAVGRGDIRDLLGKLVDRFLILGQDL